MDVRPNYAECAYLPSSIDETFKEYASHLAQSTERYSLGQSCCTGGNIGNAYYYFGSLSNLIESGSSFQPPCSFFFFFYFILFNINLLIYFYYNFIFILIIIITIIIIIIIIIINDHLNYYY